MHANKLIADIADFALMAVGSRDVLLSYDTVVPRGPLRMSS